MSQLTEVRLRSRWIGYNRRMSKGKVFSISYYLLVCNFHWSFEEEQSVSTVLCFTSLSEFSVVSV